MKLKNWHHGIAAFILASTYGFLLFTDNRFGRIGDHFYYVGHLMSNRLYALKNGFFSIPYYTPAFGAGTPMYGDPQSMNFSLLQIVFNFSPEPYFALKTAFLLCTVLSYIGCYLFLRKWTSRRWIATTGSLVFSLNGFITSRWIIGHLTFHTYFLLPWFLLTLFNLAFQTDPWDRLFNSVAGALFLSLFVYASDINSIYILMVLSLTFLVALKITSLKWRDLGVILAWASCVMVPLTGFLIISKGMATMEHLRLFPRKLDTEVFPLARVLWILGNGLFNPQYTVGRNLPFLGGWHEYSAYVGLGALAVFPLAALRLWNRHSISTRATMPQPLKFFSVWLIVLLAVIIPLMRGEGILWTELKKFPIINAYHAVYRFVGTLPLVVVGLWAAAINYLDKSEYQRRLCLILCGVALADILMFNMTNESKSHGAFGKLFFPAHERELKVIWWNTGKGYQYMPFSIGDAVTLSSQYKWGGVKANVDISKPALHIFPDGTYNVNDPVALMYPAETGKTPWTRLPVEGNQEKVVRFLNYEDPDFYVPTRQKWANWISLVAWVICLGLLWVFSIQSGRKKKKYQAQ